MSKMTRIYKSPGRTYLLIILSTCCGFLVASVYFLSGFTYKAWTPVSSAEHEIQSQNLLKLIYGKSENTITDIRNLTSVSVESRTDLESNTVLVDQLQNQRGVLDLNIEQFDLWKDHPKHLSSPHTETELNMGNNTNYTHNDLVDYGATDSEKSIQIIKKLNCSTKGERGTSANIDYGELAHVLDIKMATVFSKKVTHNKPTCNTDVQKANSCDNNKCLQLELPESFSKRIEQLVTPCQLRISPEENEILLEMSAKIKGKYDIILLTAASSNHFLESQALLKNLHENVYPFLQNFTLVFYNLGLTEHERILMIKYCKCQVVDFPFEKFSKFVDNLKCYAWKPVVIKAQIQNANVVLWMDASIRFRNLSNHLHTLIQKTRERGVQIGASSAESVFRTYRSMYHFFGDEPCAYLNFYQAKATFGVFHREYFVDRVILEPWVACALNEDCICPNSSITADCVESKEMAIRYYTGKGPIVYGMCHRYDQSAISLILHKLYKDLYQWVMVSTQSVLTIRRKDTFVYFPAHE